jgi:hypothetical protein
MNPKGSKAGVKNIFNGHHYGLNLSDPSSGHEKE